MAARVLRIRVTLGVAGDLAGYLTEATLEKGWRALFETGFKQFVQAAIKGQ